MSLWWRAENGSIDHPKLLKLSDAMHRAWYTLMCVASANGGALPPADDIAVRLRLPVTKVAEWIARLVAADLFDNVDGVFVPHNWNKRQYKSDKSDPTAGERMKRYRKNKRNGVTDVTDRNDRNAGVTVIRPEAEAEADTKQSRADTSAPVDEDLKRRASAVAAGVSAHFLSRQMPVPNLDRCLLWLTMGYGQGSILTAVETVLKRGKRPATLEYFDGAIRDEHAKAPAAPRAPEVDRTNWYIVVEGTQEHTCWNIVLKEQGKRPLFLCTQIAPDGTIYERAAKCLTLYPPGFNDFGERLPPSNDEVAA